MSTIDRTMAALKPAALDEVERAQPDAALETRIAETIRTPRDVRSPRRAAWRGIPRMPLLLTAAVATTVTAVVLPLVGRGDAPHVRPTAEPVAAPDARTFLLAGAQSIERAGGPADGRYWHVTSRRCVSEAGPLVKRPDVKPYRYTICTTTDSWTSKQGFVRTVVGLDPKVDFATRQDRANWQAAGAPRLGQQLGHTEHNDPMFAKWGLDGNRLSLSELRRLPSDPAALRKVVAKSFNGTPKNAAELDGFVWTFAPQLLTQPVTPATRAGLYRMLAQIKGVRTFGTAKDPEGRPAVVLTYTEQMPAMPGSSEPDTVETRLAFRQDTYDFLGDQFGAAGAVTNAQLVAEWTNVLGARKGPRGQS
ncbi:CU044_5270 family protein [Spirillospora sp. CA-255316]